MHRFGAGGMVLHRLVSVVEDALEKAATVRTKSTGIFFFFQQKELLPGYNILKVGVEDLKWTLKEQLGIKII